METIFNRLVKCPEIDIIDIHGNIISINSYISYAKIACFLRSHILSEMLELVRTQHIETFTKCILTRYPTSGAIQ